jgi:uncharacterized protein (DUF1800 family)
VRRTSLAPTYDAIEAAAGRDPQDVITDALADRISPVEARWDAGWGPVVTWWLDQMNGRGSGLAERMTWFWHTVLTTSGRKIDEGPMVTRQLTTLRRGALGNFRELLTELITDPGMLVYLDADGSVAGNPNENLGREVMELYTIGLGNYDESDVEAASEILAGYEVDREAATVTYHPDRGLQGDITFLKERKAWTAESMVERLCEHPATAVRISSLLWFHLVGTTRSDADAEELGRWWAAQDLEILPLVERILRDPAFLASVWSRPRTGIEFFCATRAAVGFDIDEPWATDRLGQLPYAPPSPAGWPNDRWLSPGSLLGRAAHAQGWWFEADLKRGPADIDTILDRCGLFTVAESTVAAMARVDDSDLNSGWRNTSRWRIALTSPEFQLT